MVLLFAIVILWSIQLEVQQIRSITFTLYCLIVHPPDEVGIGKIKTKLCASD